MLINKLNVLALKGTLIERISDNEKGLPSTFFLIVDIGIARQESGVYIKQLEFDCMLEVFVSYNNIHWLFDSSFWRMV